MLAIQILLMTYFTHSQLSNYEYYHDIFHDYYHDYYHDYW